MLRDWLEETHSTAFELRRHFFRRFFSSELISDPSQAKIVVGGALGIVISLSLMFAQAYYQKYRELLEFDSPEPYRRAVLADVLFLVTLVMTVTALLTTIQWPALFPDLRDYLALASLPVRMREIFLAKVSALAYAAVLIIACIALLPSIIVPAVMLGRYGSGTVWHVPGIFVASLLGGLFMFFTLVALQGVLLNLLPVRQFPRVSLAIQGSLLAILFCAFPFVLTIPSFYDRLDPLPAWSIWAPPLWFWGIDQTLMGSGDPLVAWLVRAAVWGTLAAAVAAVSTYLWSYHRHRIRILESSSATSSARRVHWPSAVYDKLFSNPPSLGVFCFIAKSLTRSRLHRLYLTAFIAIALAFIAEGFAGLVFVGGRFQGISASSAGVREAVIAIPLAISLFVLAGFRYLFRLPVELPANWLFRTVEPGNAVAMLIGVEGFLFLWGVLPVAVLTLPIEIGLLGTQTGLAVSLDCALLSCLLVEFLLFTFEKIPFTSSYLPGRRPVIETVIKNSVAVIGYVWVLASIINASVRNGLAALIFMAVLAVAWWSLRRARLAGRKIARLEFEETLEPAVHVLGIERE